MDDDNCLALIKDLCASFLTEDQRTSISEHDLAKLVKSTLSNIFVKYKSGTRNVDDGYSLLRTEIIARIIANGSKHKNHSEEIRKYLSSIEEIYQTSDEKEELNSMFLFLHKLSQVLDFTTNVPQTEDSPVSFFGGSFNGSNWSVFHRDPGPIYPAFNYPFYEPPGTGVKLIRDYCPSFEPLSNDFSKFYDGKCKLYRFDLNRPVESTSQDEGFVTPGSEFSSETDASALSFSSAMSTSSSSDECEFDSQLLKLCKKTWEQLGSEAYYPELPFASEHLESVIPLWKILNASQNIRNKTFSLDDRVVCDFEELKCDLQYLLFGMNSSSFFYNCITKTFYIRDNLHLKTLTPEILANMCDPFLKCAAFYHALKKFVEERRNLLFGPTHQVYCSSLLEVLNVYRYSILNLSWTDIHYAVQLDSIIMPFQRKLQFLTKFCLISLDEETNGSNFPSGVQLLDYLYKNLMKVFSSDFCCILIHFFEKCCNMYLKIVSEWIFDGCFSNPANYAEFFIEIQQEDELHRDWRRVSCIKLKEKRVPAFLEKFYKDIFICGKSVNLLKIFTRREVLDTLLRKDYPSIKCCFNKSQLNDYIVDWQKFQHANDQQYNSQKRVRETLFKTYGSEFYANVKRVREAWFTNYENRLKPNNIVLEEKSMEKSREVTEETFEDGNSENETCVEVPKVKSDEAAKSNVEKTEKIYAIVEKPTELKVFADKTCDETSNIAHVRENVVQDETNSSTEEQEGKPKLKTRKLVEFYEQLNLSSTSPERSPKKSPKTPAHSPRPIIFGRKTENKNKATESNTSVAEKSEVNATSPSNLLLESVSPSPFSDYKGGSGLGFKMKTSTPAAKSEGGTEKSTNFNVTGGGDFISPLMQTSVSSRIPNASGDASSQISTYADNCKIAVQLSDFQRNRLRSMYSDHQNQLNVSNDVCIEKKVDSTPLSACQQNRLKVMSSDCLNQMNDGNAVTPAMLSDHQILLNVTNDDDCAEKKVDETPLSACQQNRLKSMSSDCLNQMSDGNAVTHSMHSDHQNQFNVTNDVCTEKKVDETPLTACQQNRLKSMSSDCVNQMSDGNAVTHSMHSDHQNQFNVTNDVCTEKKVDETPLTACQQNRLKSMSSDCLNQMSDENAVTHSMHSDHQNQFNVTNDVCTEKKVDETPLTACQQNRLKSMSSDCLNQMSGKNAVTHSVLSDHQNQLYVTNDVSIEKKVDSTPLSIRQQNRLKSMSSDYLNEISHGNIISQKKAATPLSVRDLNKLKVMSSEYHQRLSTRETSKSESNLASAQPARELSEYERNKLKIMSSEYHLRLMDCASHDERIQEKLTTKTTNKLTEYQLNKLKVMATEFDLQPKSLPITPLQTSRGHERETNKMTSSYRTSTPASLGVENDKSLLSATYTDDDIAEEPETFSEDVESEDQVTVVENIAQNLPSLPMESLKNVLNDEAVSSDVFHASRGLNLDTFVSYGPVAFACRQLESINCLQTAAKSVHDVDRTSMLYYLSQSIRIPLKVQTKIVNDAILRVFIEEEGYLEHLTTLRNYLLLRKPEFRILLTNTMFKMAENVKKPYLLLNNYTLSCLLQQALLAGNARESIHFERKLYFVVDDVMPQAFDLQDIKVLKCISLNYAVKWPINVLITEPIIKKYSRIFKFLMQIQLAMWTLKSDFKGLKNLKRGKSTQYTLIQMYRHSMTQVIRILHEFVMREGIERCWNELVEYLSNSEITLDGLYISHLKYINKIIQRCFLCDQSATCLESVLNLLSSVLQYHGALRSGTWHRNVQVNFLYHTNFKNIQATFKQFQQHLNEVRDKLKLLVYAKQRLYFEPLLVELSR